MFNGRGRCRGVRVGKGQGCQFHRQRVALEGDGVVEGMVGLRGTRYNTDSFCFFFGPGLPLGLGSPSGVSCAAPRLAPGFGPGMPFRFAPVAGGASELDGVLIPLAAGVAAGVAAAESVGFSDGVGSPTWATGVSDDEDCACDDFDDGSVACGNLERWSGDSLRMTVLDLAGLVDIFRRGGGGGRRQMEFRCRRCAAMTVCWG